MSQPEVTIVVVPRERFSCAQESLESIYEHTEFPFKLVYVDGNSPAQVRRYLEAQAQAQDFQLIRTDYYLSPNHARNIGLAQVDTKYLVFVDNDVIVSPGWLKSLFTCAEETGAAVVGPLMCQDLPLHQTVHFAGGESHIVTDKKGRRHLREKMYKQGQKVAEVQPNSQRQPIELAEFHCMLVRTSIFERVGFLDEAVFNTKEHLDFCMSVAEAGGTVYFEPECLVTYVQAQPQWRDMHYYMLRWSDAWTWGSLDRLREKWNLTENEYFQRRYKNSGWRREGKIINPLSRRLTFGIKSHWLRKILVRLDKVLNRYLTSRHARTQAQRRSNLTQSHRFSPATELPKEEASLKH